MKQLQAFLILLMATFGLWACATAPSASAPSSKASPDRGDRALRQGVYWYQKGCISKAMNHFRVAHEHFCLNDHQAGVTRSLNSMANVYWQAGNPENAMLFYDAAIEQGRRCDDQTALAQALVNKAAAFIERKALSDAEVLLDEARLLSREKGTVFALVLNYQAVLAVKAGRFAEARVLLDLADTAVSDDDDRVCAVLAFTRGRMAMHAGELKNARMRFETALERDRRSGHAKGIADDLIALADVHERLGEDESALDCLDRGIKVYALMENHAKVNESLDHLQQLADKTGGDIRLTVHFVNQWLAGQAADAICR